MLTELLSCVQDWYDEDGERIWIAAHSKLALEDNVIDSTSDHDQGRGLLILIVINIYNVKLQAC